MTDERQALDASRQASGRAPYIPLLIGCTAVLALTIMAAAGIGSVHYSLSSVATALRHGPPDLSPTAPEPDPVVLTVWTFRIPRILLAAVAGACLAAAGVAFQALLRNDLADPYVIGVSGGASVGIEAVLLRHGETWLYGFGAPISGFVTAAIALTFVYAMARRGGRIDIPSLLLGGVVISSVLGAVSMLLLQLGHSDDAMHVMNRLMGSFADATTEQAGIVALFLFLGLAALLTQSRSMDMMSLGEDTAQQLGVDVDRFKTTLIVLGAVLTAATVAMAGIVGFVGLIVPHVARRLTGTPLHSRVIPIAALVGAILLVWADTAARSIMPDGREIPVGVITSFLGGPFFLVLLRRGGARRAT